MIPTLDDLLDESTWLEWRALALTPQVVTELRTTAQARAEFVAGARLLRLDQDGKHVLPHQLLVSDFLTAGFEENGLLVPRRSSKTTSALAVILGRCVERGDHAAAMTLTTTAAKTSERFRLDVFAPLERAFPDERARPFKVYKGKGSEHVAWPNGSLFAALTPNGDAFRSGAYDTVLIDESGEATPEQGSDLAGAILPTFDTREGAQAIYAGTAGDYRDGLLLWDALHAPNTGKLSYAFPEDTTEDELAAWDRDEENPYARVRELVELSHPGVASGLTSLDKVRDRYLRLGPERFAREYGGMFGQVGAGSGVFNAQRWAAAADDTAPLVPERFAIGVMPAWDARTAAVVAAWRDEAGRACLYVLDHRAGTTWLADAAAGKARQHNLPLVYDSASSAMRVEVEAMSRMVPRPRLEPQTWANVSAAAALLVKEANNSNLRHWGQPALNDAAKVAVRRASGPNAWALGRPPRDAEADICALEAGALALRWYDDNPSRRTFAPIIAA